MKKFGDLTFNDQLVRNLFYNNVKLVCFIPQLVPKTASSPVLPNAAHVLPTLELVELEMKSLDADAMQDGLDPMEVLAKVR